MDSFGMFAQVQRNISGKYPLHFYEKIDKKRKNPPVQYFRCLGLIDLGRSKFNLKKLVLVFY